LGGIWAVIASRAAKALLTVFMLTLDSPFITTNAVERLEE